VSSDFDGVRLPEGSRVKADSAPIIEKRRLLSTVLCPPSWITVRGCRPSRANRDQELEATRPIGELMSLRDILSIAIPTVGLLVLAQPGEPRWILRPWFASRPPRRRWFIVFDVVILVGAIVHAVA
jgi:hypothetical protein